MKKVNHNEENLLKDLIQEIRDNGCLPVLNDNVTDICSITNKKNANSAELANIIMRDCGLSSHLLSTINSALYGLRYQINTISTAVRLLGFNRILALATGLSIFKNSLQNVHSLQLAQLYANSYFSGSFAMNASRITNIAQKEEVFVAGLLHSLPYVVIAHTFPEKFAHMEEMIKSGGMNLNQAFKNIFEVDYKDLCGSITDIYKLPDQIQGFISGNSTSRSSIIKPAHDIVTNSSDLSAFLFGLSKVQHLSWRQLEDQFKHIIKSKDFLLSEFVASSCRNDHNISKFFQLNDEDIKGLVRQLNGKNPVPGLANQLIITEKLGYEITSFSPTQVVSGFFKDIKENGNAPKSINDFLELAQETLFRCLPNDDVILMLYNRQRRTVTGRFYMGQKKHIEAKEFFLNLGLKKNMNSPICNAINNQKPVDWQGNSFDLGFAPRVSSQRPFNRVHVHPLVINGNSIGCYLIGRCNGSRKFNSQEHDAISQVSDAVIDAFARFAK